ncbi:MAG: hypothetical protein GQ527_06610, partial [Bacteroidales bacterium]|nr:hypothetical protein [Bacteroidales bacterium]
MLELIKKISKGKRIVILGFGLEGQSSLRFLMSDTIENEVVIIDRNVDLKHDQLIKDYHIKYFSGEHYLDSLRANDFIIKSPGVKLGEKFHDIKTYSQTSLFLEKYQHQIIG